MTTNVIEKVENKRFKFFPEYCDFVYVDEIHNYRKRLRNFEKVKKEISMKVMDHIPSDLAYSLLPESQAFFEKFYNLYKPLERKLEGHERLMVNIMKDSVNFSFNLHWHPYLHVYTDKVKMNWVDLTTADILPEYVLTRYYGESNKEKSREDIWARFLQVECYIFRDY